MDSTTKSDTEIKNPFIVEGYESPELFCDREKETQELISALKNGRNVTMISPRRMGKSGLIRHAFNQLKISNPEIVTYYIDILYTQSLRDFVKVLGAEIIGSLDSKFDKILQKVVKTFGSFRPVIETDLLTGAPKIAIDLRPGEEEHTLKELMAYLKNSGKRCFVAIDEFQQITEYPEKGIEGLLRSYIQFMPNVNFVFSGSRQHMMQEMFILPSRPFYQSTQTLSLKQIPEESYYEFASRLFLQKGINIEREAFHYLYDNVMGHTWYIQYWLNKLYEWSEENITEQTVRTTLERILREEDDNMYAYFSTCTTQQQRVLTAVAKEGEVTNPQSSDFIQKHSLPALSTVKSCIKSLLSSEFLLDNRGAVSVYNRFLMLWLRYR